MIEVDYSFDKLNRKRETGQPGLLCVLCLKVIGDGRAVVDARGRSHVAVDTDQEPRLPATGKVVVPVADVIVGHSLADHQARGAVAQDVSKRDSGQIVVRARQCETGRIAEGVTAAVKTNTDR